MRRGILGLVLWCAAMMLTLEPVAATTVDGLFDAVGSVKSGSTLNVTIAGRGGVPVSGVGSVALNVTVTNPTGPGFLTVWPAGGSRPLASNLNYVSGQTVPNMVIVPLGVGGQVSIYALYGTDVVIDVLGWFPVGDGFHGLTPARLMDTRSDLPTVDGQAAGGGSVPGSGTVNLTIAGRGGVPSAGAGSVALNVTVANPVLAGFLTVWPAGSSRPVASNLNYEAGKNVPNMVIVPLGAGGQISIFALSGTDVVVDVLGWFPAGGGFNGLNPARLMDSRSGLPTIDGLSAGGSPIPGTGTVDLRIAGRGGVPSLGAGSVALNVTVTNPTAIGFLTVWPTASPRPLASNLNYSVGQSIPNMVMVPLGAGGQVSIYALAGTDVVVDVLGWFPDGGGFNGLNPARLLDTRLPEPPPTSEPPPPPTTLTFNAGTYLVNSQLPPGRYQTTSSQNCYWERLSGLGGTLDEIITNDFETVLGPIIVDIRASDLAFRFTGNCGKLKSWTPAAAAPNIGPGSHVVGVDTAAGTYAANAADGCYWARLTSFDGDLDSIIANDFVGTGGPQLVTISSSDVGFYSNNTCGTWTRV